MLSWFNGPGHLNRGNYTYCGVSMSKKNRSFDVSFKLEV
jgi:hypothetical protein